MFETFRAHGVAGSLNKKNKKKKAHITEFFEKT